MKNMLFVILTLFLDAAGTDAVVVAFALVRLLAAVAGVDFF